MKKPVIGIVPLVDRERESYWMLPGYMEGISQAGGIPVMLPLTRDEETVRTLSETLDGFVLPGGQDVSPEVYGRPKLPECTELCEERDWMEEMLLAAALELDKPVLGICRGIQLINAALGGTLNQDIPAFCPSEVDHHQKPPYDAPVHSVKIETDSPLYGALGAEEIRVNSCHHQGIEELAGELRPMATAQDGLIEAVQLPGKKFVWAVQWHPEFSWKTDENSRKLFRAFVEACAKE